eukprot:TRINITY_DN11831_c0_g1_i1.p1 TRINITY_DN11831_c0_g1~~TRINITY_DN11831_c0_g1_i1.p1  ORF type:complete len:160 (+),score=54.98 TRINITY_DN11831_c0_g1_i1:92-571(+)
MSQKFILKMRCVGGEPANMATLAPKLGPLGVAPKKVSDDIALATKDYKSIKCMIELTIENRQTSVVVIPTSSTLVLKALKEPPRDRKKVKNVTHTGDIPLEDFYGIVRKLRDHSLSKTFSGTCLEILGTARSVGCTVGGMKPKDLTLKIKSGELQTPTN